MNKKRILDEIDQLIKEARGFQRNPNVLPYDPDVDTEESYNENYHLALDQFIVDAYAKLRVVDGFDKAILKNTFEIEEIIDNLYDFKDKIEGYQEIPKFDFNSVGEFCWLGQCKRLSPKAEKYLHMLKNAPNNRVDLSDKTEKEKDDYRTNYKENAIKNLMAKFKVKREIVKKILLSTKTEHWIDHKNVK